jgi:hypothetical protein
MNSANTVSTEARYDKKPTGDPGVHLPRPPRI